MSVRVYTIVNADVCLQMWLILRHTVTAVQGLYWEHCQDIAYYTCSPLSKKPCLRYECLVYKYVCSIHTYIHTYICVYVCLCELTYLYIYIRTCTYVSVYIRTCVYSTTLHPTQQCIYKIHENLAILLHHMYICNLLH